jgi:photosystem II stability/assembly factor-like uncharacterized protein
MAIQTPVIYNNGTIQPLPSGDTISGASGDISALPVNSSIIYPVQPSGTASTVAIGSTYWTVSGIRTTYDPNYHDLTKLSARYKEYGSDVVIGSAVAITSGSIIWDGSQWMILVTGTAVNNLFTSPDGVTWTARTIAAYSFNATSRLVTNGSIWVAITGVATQFYTSTDAGVTWTLRTSGGPTSGAYGNAIWNGTRFVTPTSGQPYYSNDGITWAAASGAATNQTAGIVWTGSKFIAVGNSSSNISTSADGITWTNAPMPGSNTAFCGLAYGGGYVVAVNTYGEVYRSADNAATWTLVSKLSGYPITYPNMIYANGAFFIRAYYSFLTSTDGTNWTDISATQPTTNASPGFAHNGSYILSLGGSISTMAYKLQTWTGTPNYIMCGFGNNASSLVGATIVRTK